LKPKNLKNRILPGLINTNSGHPFVIHCCDMGTATEHPVPDRVEPLFVIFDIRAL